MTDILNPRRPWHATLLRWAAGQRRAAQQSAGDAA